MGVSLFTDPGFTSYLCTAISATLSCPSGKLPFPLGVFSPKLFFHLVMMVKGFCLMPLLASPPSPPTDPSLPASHGILPPSYSPPSVHCPKPTAFKKAGIKGCYCAGSYRKLLSVPPGGTVVQL